MDLQKSEQDLAVARSLVYLVGAVLLIVMFAVVSLFLEAELKQQQALRSAAERPSEVRVTSPTSDGPTKKPWPWLIKRSVEPNLAS